MVEYYSFLRCCPDAVECENIYLNKMLLIVHIIAKTYINAFCVFCEQKAAYMAKMHEFCCLQMCWEEEMETL